MTAIVLDIETAFSETHRPPPPEEKYNKCPVCKQLGGEPCFIPTDDKFPSKDGIHEGRKLSANQPKPPAAFHPIRSDTWVGAGEGGDRVVCVGLKVIGGDRVQYASIEEKAQLEHLNAFLDSCPAAYLVTFNGSRFDLPFLFLRCKLLGVDAGRIYSYWRGDNRRWHIDLCRELEPYKRMIHGGGGDLDSWCRFFDIGGKPVIDPYGVMDGSKVQALVDAGDTENLLKYNAHDLELTEALYLKVQALGLIDGGA